jgi:phage gp36-like protein
MATWITVTADDVRLLENEKTIMESVDASQTLQQCVDSAANFARGYVPAPRAPAPTVPPEVVDDVAAIARASYLSQEPSGTLLTELRQRERDNAIAHLKDVAKGLAMVTAPDVQDTANVQTGASIAVIDQKRSSTQSDRIGTRDRLKGF